MNNTTTPTTSTPLRAKANEARWQSKIYHAVVTPINFITFLVSLYLVDSRNRAQRHRQPDSKASGNNGRTWLRRLLYSQPSSPYDWVDSYQERLSLRYEVRLQGEDAAPRATKDTEGPWFYHTKQKKLFRAEAADAFALRNSVLFALGLLAVSVGWVLWRTMMWLAARVLNWIVLATV
ncbi:hypothetical protein F5Y12DRAFT_499764 [Xylaria sp. FL1777]|nr:hypothetical protein F5Y12DRAFT_499764 [Xylaria sp. FL1777]